MIQLCDKDREHIFIHSLKIINHSDNTVCLPGKIYRSIRKSDPPHVVNIDIGTQNKKIM